MYQHSNSPYFKETLEKIYFNCGNIIMPYFRELLQVVCRAPQSGQENGMKGGVLISELGCGLTV